MDSADILLQVYARQVSNRMKKDTTTSTSELQAYGDLYFPKHFFLGVYPADMTPERPAHRAFYVQNTLRSDSTERNGHWVAVALEPGQKPLLFDSFGRKPSATFMPHLMRANTTDPDRNQEWESTRCGQLSLAFGQLYLTHGYAVARLA